VTRTEERLRDLLQEVARDPVDVSFEAVAARVRRRRRVALTAGLTAVVVLGAGVAVSVAALRGGDGQPQGIITSPQPTTSGPAHRSAVFHGIAYLMPAGWSVTKAHCGFPDHAVAEGVWTGSCPGGEFGVPTPTGVTLTAVIDPRGAISWPGTRTLWQGQPAWLSHHTTHGVAAATLTLPWLNAVVTAYAPNAGRARALLDRVSVHPAAGLSVPPAASSVFIQSLAGRDGDGQNRSTTVTSTTDVHELLADLQSLNPNVPAVSACNGSWWPDTALLTVRGADGATRTYAARFGGCEQVVAGTGNAAVTSTKLLVDIRHLLPNSGL
jgi:hypothetical protein